MRRILRRIVAAIFPSLSPSVVYGARPGLLWCQADGEWVPEEESWRAGGNDLAVYGPLYDSKHGHP